MKIVSNLPTYITGLGHKNTPMILAINCIPTLTFPFHISILICEMPKECLENKLVKTAFIIINYCLAIHNA